MQDAELGAVGAGALEAEEHHHKNGNSNYTGDTTVGDGYGGPNTRYTTAVDPVLPSHDVGYGQPDARYNQPATGYTPTTAYGSQSIGVASNMPEMEGTANHPYVQHHQEPYTGVHHGSYVHSNPESNAYSR